MSTPTYGEMRTRAERIYDEIIKERVLAGLEALQRDYGDAWVEKIDCEELDLSNEAQCVLGQVYGSFDDGLSEIVPEGNTAHLIWARDHGFYDDDCDYSDLDEAWHAILCDKEAIPGAAS